MKRSLHIVCQDSGSLDKIIKELIPYFKEEFVVTREGLEEPLFRDILLVHYLIPAVVNDPSFETFKFKVLIQPLDGTEIKQEYLKDINKFDLIITPSQAGRRILQNHYISKPIVVIPNWYSKALGETSPSYLTEWFEEKIPYAKNKFIFFHDSTLIARKNFEQMCYCYLETFSTKELHDKVVLIIKAPPHENSDFEYVEEIKKDLIWQQKQYRYPATILKISQYLTDFEIAGIMSQTDCYVGISHMEGFGIPLLEAAYFGVPCIVFNNTYSGYQDFLGKDNENYWIDCFYSNRESDKGWLYSEGSMWCYTENQKVQDAYMSAYKKENHDNTFLKNKMKYSINIISQQYIHHLKNEQ